MSGPPKTAATFSGKPCKRCGSRLRYSGNTQCVECKRQYRQRDIKTAQNCSLANTRDPDRYRGWPSKELFELPCEEMLAAIKARVAQALGRNA